MDATIVKPIDAKFFGYGVTELSQVFFSIFSTKNKSSWVGPDWEIKSDRYRSKSIKLFIYQKKVNYFFGKTTLKNLRGYLLDVFKHIFSVFE